MQRTLGGTTPRSPVTSTTIPARRSRAPRAVLAAAAGLVLALLAAPAAAADSSIHPALLWTRYLGGARV